MIKYYDIHCHVFNKNVIIRRLVNVVQSLLTIADTDDMDEAMQKIEGMITTLDVVATETSEDVFKVLDDTYGGEFIVTPLMLDLTYADDNDGNERRDRRYRRRIELIFRIIKILLPFVKGKMKTQKAKDLVDKLKVQIKDFYKNFEVRTDKEVELFDEANYQQQLNELEHLASNYPHVKPFYSVDPRQEYTGGKNIIDQLKDKLQGPHAKFYGVKLYAPVGFSPTDPVLMGTNSKQGVYEFCVINKIPLTVHCSNSGFACLSKDLIVRGHVNEGNKITEFSFKKIHFDKHFLGLHAGEAIAERATTLNHPKLWEIVMQKYPDLIINFAHFGGSSQLLNYVLYRVSDNKIKVKDFEDSMEKLPVDVQNTIRTGFVKKRRKMHYLEHLPLAQKKKLWNTMYHANLIDNWAKAIFDIVRNPDYPNAFVDVSCFSEGKMIELPETDNNQKVYSIKEGLTDFKTSFYDKLSDYEKSKILYGSDYFLLQFFGSDMKQYLADFKSVFGSEFDQIASVNPKRFLSEKN